MQTSKKLRHNYVSTHMHARAQFHGLYLLSEGVIIYLLNFRFTKQKKAMTDLTSTVQK